ncbi:MAG: flagellar hook-length control protein FliK [Oceanospirillaceae bacterium]
MAVPTLPVSIGSPTELIAPRPASVSSAARSNSDAFKSELHNASQSNSVSKNQHLSKDSEKNSSKSIDNEKVATSANGSERSSSLSAKDTNVAKAANQQLQNGSDVSANTQEDYRSQTEQNISDTPRDNGKNLPPQGDELPQNVHIEDTIEQSISNLKDDIAAKVVDVSSLSRQNVDTAYNPALTTVPVASSAVNLDEVPEDKVVTPSVTATSTINPGFIAQANTVNNDVKLNENFVASALNVPSQTQAVNSQQVGAINTVATVVDNTAVINSTAVNKSNLEVQQSNSPNTIDKNLSFNPTKPLQTIRSEQVNVGERVIKPNNPEFTKASIASEVPDKSAIGKAINVEANVVKPEVIKSNAEPQNVTVNTDKLVNQVNGSASQAVDNSVSAANKNDAASAALENAEARFLKSSSENINSPVVDQVLEPKVISPLSVMPRNIVGSNETVDIGSLIGSVSSVKNLNAGNNVANSINNSTNLLSEPKNSIETVVNETAKLQNNLEAKRFDPSVNQTQSGLSANTASVSSPLVLDPSVALNQSLEKMRAGIESKINSDAASNSEELAKDAKSGITKSVTASEGLAQLASLQGGLRSSSPVQMQMPPGTPPTSNNWGKAVVDKVYIAASQNLRVANIHLDPPELGALQIRLQVTGPDQQMSVSFTSPHASVRDALDQQLPRLREMLEEQGINLGESSVNDQSSDNNQQAADSDQQGSAGYASQNDIESTANPLNTQGTLSLVDFYA